MSVRRERATAWSFAAVLGLALGCHERLADDVDVEGLCADRCALHMSCASSPGFVSEAECFEVCTSSDVWDHDSCRYENEDYTICMNALTCAEYELMASFDPTYCHDEREAYSLCKIGLAD